MFDVRDVIPIELADSDFPVELRNYLEERFRRQRFSIQSAIIKNEVVRFFPSVSSSIAAADGFEPAVQNPAFGTHASS
jgi:hypothetical protein